MNSDRVVPSKEKALLCGEGYGFLFELNNEQTAAGLLKEVSMTLREYHQTELDYGAYIYLYDHNKNRLGAYNSYSFYPESHEKALLKYYGDCIVLDVVEKNKLGDIAITILKDKPKVHEDLEEIEDYIR